MIDQPEPSNDQSTPHPRRKLTPEEVRQRLADETLSWTDRTAGIFYDPDRRSLTPQEENDAFEIAVVNDVLESDARSGIEGQGLLL
jgi:hypothetical protein